MIRRVYRERALALAGPRALLMQAAHPLAVSGLLAHTGSLEEPYERLARTAVVMDTVTFGSRAEADRVTRRRARDAPHGARNAAAARRAVPDAAPPTARTIPELLMWVLYSLVDSGDDRLRHVRPQPRRRRARGAVGRLPGGREGSSACASATCRRPSTTSAPMATRCSTSGRLVVTPWARSRAREIVLDPPVPRRRASRSSRPSTSSRSPCCRSRSASSTDLPRSRRRGCAARWSSRAAPST